MTISIKNINPLKNHLITDELNDVIKEKYIVVSVWDGIHKNKKWHKIYLSENKCYAKVVPKSELFDSIITDIDHKVLLSNFYKKNKYSFLPEYLFETENFICFKFYNDYSPLRLDDLIESPVLKISNLLGINLKLQKVKPTYFFKDVICNFHALYQNEIIETNLSEATRNLLGLQASSPLLNYLCFTPSCISIEDFSVKRDDTDKIVDWKYTDIDNWDILMPNYIFNISGTETDDDTHHNLQRISYLYDSPTVILTHKSEYYDAGLIKDIEN